MTRKLSLSLFLMAKGDEAGENEDEEKLPSKGMETIYGILGTVSG